MMVLAGIFCAGSTQSFAWVLFTSVIRFWSIERIGSTAALSERTELMLATESLISASENSPTLSIVSIDLLSAEGTLRLATIVSVFTMLSQ